MTDLAFTTATELRALLSRGEIQPVDIAEALLARIAERDATVRAWAHLDPDAVRAAAARLVPGEGVLAGIPVGFKDICDTVDMPTSYGSPIYAGHRPVRDAACVQAVRHGGGLVFGKCTTTEFATRHPSPTRNPHDPARTPGGSSSGSAAAVADGQVPLAIGSQTVGSTIRPAGYCGVYAFKPTLDAMPVAGLKVLCGRFDTVGLLARSLDDLALFRAGLLGMAARPVAPAAGRLRIGFCRTSAWERVTPEVAGAVEAAVAALSDAGEAVTEVAYPAEIDDVEALHWQVVAFDMARQLAFEYAEHRDLVSAWSQERIELGLAIDDATHLANLARVRALETAVDRLFDTVDVLVLPSSLDVAPAFEDGTGEPSMCSPMHIAGVPAMSLPLETTGLPIGLQVVARRHADLALLAASARIESLLFPARRAA